MSNTMALRLKVGSSSANGVLNHSRANNSRTAATVCGSHGFIGFCTGDGLSRFDGAQFVTYRVGDKNAPPGIESLYQTRDGTYWITTTAGLYRFKPEAVSQPKEDHGNRPFLNAEFVGR